MCASVCFACIVSAWAASVVFSQETVGHIDPFGSQFLVPSPFQLHRLRLVIVELGQLLWLPLWRHFIRVVAFALPLRQHVVCPCRPDLVVKVPYHFSSLFLSSQRDVASLIPSRRAAFCIR